VLNAAVSVSFHSPYQSKSLLLPLQAEALRQRMRALGDSGEVLQGLQEQVQQLEGQAGQAEELQQEVQALQGQAGRVEELRAQLQELHTKVGRDCCCDA
jgi:TolA-binding protein